MEINDKNSKIYFIALAVCVCLTTLFIRIPLPSGGYFNFGDVAVVFAGFLIGASNVKFSVVWALLVGGLGSATADVVGGYALFAPLTAFAKGLECFLAALAIKQSNYVIRIIYLLFGGSVMIGTYFVGEYLMPSYGLQGAIAEVIPNIVQAVGGAIGGSMVYRLFKLFG